MLRVIRPGDTGASRQTISGHPPLPAWLAVESGGLVKEPTLLWRGEKFALYLFFREIDMMMSRLRRVSLLWRSFRGTEKYASTICLEDIRIFLLKLQ